MPVGPIYTWTDPLRKPESVADMIHNLDWKTAPLLNILGYHEANVDRLLRGAVWPAKKPEWINDTQPPRATTLAEAMDTTETAVTVASGTGGYFREGDILAVLDASADDVILEYYFVQSISGDDLTILRDYPDVSGTGVAAASGDGLVRVTRAKQEFSTPEVSWVTAATRPWNHVQILDDVVSVSATDQAVIKYGPNDELDYRMEKRFVNGNAAGSLMQDFERTFFHDLRKERTSVYNGSMGGFNTFVSTNVVNASGAALAESHIREVVRGIVSKSASLDFMLMSFETRDYFDNLYDSRIQTTMDENRGGSAIEYVRTSNGGDVQIIGHPECRDDEIYFVNREYAGWVPLRPFAVKDVVETDDGYTQRVIGEYSFVLTNEVAHGKITNFAYS